MEGKLMCESVLNNNNSDEIIPKHRAVGKTNSHHIKAIFEKESKLDINSLAAEVRAKLLTDTTLPYKPRTDTAFICKFLRVKKYNVDATVKGISQYYNHIHRNIRIVEGIKPAEYSEPFDSHTLVTLKHRLNGSSVIYGRIKNWNTKHFGLRDLQCAGLFYIEELLKDNENQVNGLSAIFDMGGLGFSHLRQFNAYEVKNSIQMLLDGLPTRIAGVHAINVPTLFWPIHKVIMKLLPEKIRNRIFIHDNLESLHKVVSPEILPESLGGHLEDSEAIDEHLIGSLIKSNPIYDSYWNGESFNRPRRLSRKRSSLMIS